MEIKASPVSTVSQHVNPTYQTNENPQKEDSIQLDHNPWNIEGGDKYPGIPKYTTLDDE